MGLNGDNDLAFDDGGKCVSCSICLETVDDNGNRSWAKLQCGHRFHLDCIGSAFNAKGSMQCPNCRKIEKGQWLYANGCHSTPEFSLDDWTHDEDLYDISYSEMSFGIHWCPFGEMTELPSPFEEGEFSSTAFYNPLGQRGLFAEHTSLPSAALPCPYITYLPIHPSSSNSNGSVSDASNLNGHWNGPSRPSELPGSYAFPPLDHHYHSWENHSPAFSTSNGHVASADPPSIAPTTQRSNRANSDISRSGSFIHPFIVSHSSGARPGSSAASSPIPPYPGSNARTRDRVQALQAYYQQQRPIHSVSARGHIVSGARRSGPHRGMGQVASSSDQTNGFYFFPTASSGRNFREQENIIPTRFHLWERDHLPSFLLSQVDRDSGREGFRATPGGPEPGLRHGVFRP